MNELMDKLRNLTSNKTAMIGGGALFLLVGISSAVFIGLSNRENYMAKADDDQAESFEIPDEPQERTSSGGGQYVDSLSFLRGQRREAAQAPQEEAPAQEEAKEESAPKKEEDEPKRQVAKLEGMSLPANGQQSQSQQTGMGTSNKLSKLGGSSTMGVKSLSSGGGLKGFGSKISSRRGATAGGSGKKKSGTSNTFGFGSSASGSGSSVAGAGSSGIAGSSLGSDSGGLASGSIASTGDDSSSGDGSSGSGTEESGGDLSPVGVNTSKVKIALWDCGGVEDGDEVRISVTTSGGSTTSYDVSTKFPSSGASQSDPPDSELTSSTYTKEFPVEDGENTLTIMALNEGDSPPNTGCLRYTYPSDLTCGSEDQGWSDLTVNEAVTTTISRGTGCSE